MSSTNDKWRENAQALAILYGMLEKGLKFSTLLEGDHKFLEPIFETMFRRELLGIEGGHYMVIRRGIELRDRMVAMFHQTVQFEVFGAVNIDAQLSDDMVNPEKPWLVHDDLDDPRFHDGPNTVDMRLAMMTFITERLKDDGKLNGDFDPYLIVFMQRLADGKFGVDDYWYHLRSGEIFTEVERVVQSAYQWRSIAQGNEVAGALVMRNLYQAGMCQQRKLEGEVCSRCDTHLGMFIYYAEQERRRLDHCPNPECNRLFPPPSNIASGDFQCPLCHGAIHPTDHQCRTCDAVINWNQPEGSVHTTTVHEEVYEPVVVWSGGYYGYTPYYYDPIDPFLVGAACGLTLGLILD